MNRNPFLRPAISGAVALLAFELICALPAYGAMPPGSPWDAAAPAASPASGPASRAGVSVYFEDYSIALLAEPAIVHERMMVPGIALLQGLGYVTEWDAESRTLAATQAGKASFVYRADSAEAEIGGATVRDLPAPPFVKDDALWIPLRTTVEACGMTVNWDPANRMAYVKDPNALPRFTVTAKASGGGSASVSPALSAELKSRLGADASVRMFAPAQYTDRVHIAIAAGDMDALMLLPGDRQYQDDLIASISVDVTDLLDGFPRLKQLAFDPARGLTAGGRIYGIPLPQDPHDAPFPAVRQDWMNKLGLAQPKTMDEVYQVLKAFTDLDPDGNGKSDTYGMTGFVPADGLGSFAWVEQAYTGSPGRFSAADGRVVDHAVTGEETSALEWLARAYADGVIDKEFPIITQEQAMDRVREGRAGMASLRLDEAASLSEGATDWTPLSGVKADALASPIAPWSNQNAGVYIVTKMAKIPPERILSWLEQGVKQFADGGEAEPNGVTEADRPVLRSLFGTSDLLKDAGSLPNLSSAERDAYAAAVKEWRNVSYADADVPGIAKLWSTGKYADLNAQLERFKIKVILGAASIDDWNRQVQKMTASEEYREMMDELNDLVQNGSKP
ncbi:stalk domain-containing protein [Cohnella caldifontis]|uniref:stalk domain-containing protein n=1 Tax=Cohnella caldifontis TaxID=3027471 RepID=UPI0023ED597F|nr:stalk domain-containing protein [Cohnella sp. YIM B05605]